MSGLTKNGRQIFSGECLLFTDPYAAFDFTHIQFRQTRAETPLHSGQTHIRGKVRQTSLIEHHPCPHRTIAITDLQIQRQIMLQSYQISLTQIGIQFARPAGRIIQRPAERLMPQIAA